MITKTLLFLFTLIGVEATNTPAPIADVRQHRVAEQANARVDKPAILHSNSLQVHPSEPTARKPATLRVAARLSAREVVDKVQRFYTDTQQLTALFRQTYTNATFGKKSISDGKVWIKKPGKMRWDYKGKRIKVKKSFVSDGATLWAVEHDNKQVLTQNLDDNMLPVAITFLYGKGDLSRDFSASLDGSGKYGQKNDYVLELTPRVPSAQYKLLYLVVDRSDFRVKQSIVIEASDNVNHFRFYSPDTKKPVKNSWFVVNVKKLQNYRLVTPQADAN